MAGTPEEDLLGWLEREEERLGFSTVEEGLEDMESARDLFYDELGYDITEEQFAGLKYAQELRYELLPEVGVTYTLRETKAGWYPQYRYMPTGQFISGEAAFGLLGLEY